MALECYGKEEEDTAVQNIRDDVIHTLARVVQSRLEYRMCFWLLAFCVLICGTLRGAMRIDL